MKCIACLKLILIHEHGVTISLTLNIHAVRLNTNNFFVIVIHAYTLMGMGVFK